MTLPSAVPLTVGVHHSCHPAVADNDVPLLSMTHIPEQLNISLKIKCNFFPFHSMPLIKQLVNKAS